MGALLEITPDLVQEVTGHCGLPIGRPIADQVCAYMQLLQKWNARMNLTALIDPVEILENLFAESFLGAQLLQRDDSPCLDVGSGAGFPGMAMKIYRPDLDMILLEPRQKRAAFLATLRRELGLTGVEILSCRLEASQTTIFKQLPVVLISRGLGNQEKILRAGRPLLQGSRKVLLFTTPDLAALLCLGLDGIQWNDPVPVPWNNSHVLLQGQWIS